MNLRYISLLLLLVFVAGIGAISAEDISDIGEISSDEVADEVISVDDSVTDVSTSDADEVTSDVEPTRSSTYTWGDFKSEVEDTSVNTVKLNQSNIAPSSDSSDQISINHDITIVGGYGYYIGNADWNSAVSYNYIPMITSGNNLNVNFENVTFQYLSNNIFIKLMGNGNYAFKNCVFNNINCTGDHQSVIWLNYGYALIENCTFTNVKSSFGAVTNYYTSWGTAVNNARMTVRDSTFKDNYATTEPGAINNCGKLEVYDSTFENNEAYWWAGAIHTHSNANTTIVRSNFSNNIAGWNGGALYSYSYLTVINSTFTANEAHQTSGGAIAASAYGSSPTVVIENCDFDDNYAVGSGGAIQFGGTSLTVNDSRFNNNNASGGTGGAISSGDTTANINNCNFTNNSASARGGAVYAGGAGYLNVYYSNFKNNTGSEGNDIAYYYTTKKNNAAFLTYDYNEFWGVDNASGSIYTYNTQYLVVNPGNHNQFHDIGEYVTPIEENSTTDNNDTNQSTNFISIPDGTTIGTQLWNASLDGALGGTPLINGDYIYVPNGHNVYCYNINTGALLWNVSSQWGYFHELALHNNVIIAPCSWDKLYFIDANTGALIQNESNIYPGSSIYAPLVVGDMIYISSEYAYDDAWIAVIEYVNGEYVYNGNILEIYDVPYGEQGLLSQPVADSNGNIWVNTVDGLVRIDPYTYNYDIILNGTYGKPVVVDYVIYSLAFDNRIYGITSDGYIGASDVISSNLGNSLVFSDYGVLFFVTDDGVLRVLSNDLIIYDVSLQLNTVSSNIVSIGGVLYIGDDAGILWAIDASLQGNPILWAYDTCLGILGTPVVADGVVYVGNNETFYALSDVVSRNLIVNNVNNGLKSFNTLKTSKDHNILSFTNDEEFLTDSFNHVYVSVNGTGDGLSVDNPTSLSNAITANIADNTIIHIADGNYEVTSQVTIQAKENITIVADNPGKVNIAYKSTNKVYLTLKGINNFSVIGINFNYTYTLITFGTATLNGKSNFCPTNIVIDKCNFDGNGVKVSAINSGLTGTRNLTISNSNFTSSNARFLSITTSLSDYKQGFSNYVLGECVVNITNCNFYNCSTDALYLSDPKDNQNSPNSVIKHYIDNCKFYNTGLTVAVGTQLKTDSVFEIKNCVFNNEKGPSIVNTFSSGIPGGIFTFENNNISSDYAIQLGANAKVISPLTFRILNNESIKVPVNEPVDLIGELVDDKGNRIYHAGLKLDVNGSEMSPVINQNGLYVLSFTPEVMGELQIDVICNPIDELDAAIFTLIVSGNPNLTVNCNDSVYGDPFNVNVTLDNGVSGENVTFSIIDSTGNVIKSINSKIDNAFANASFEYVPVGDYTVRVTYDGDENFGASSVSRAFSISKANSTVQIIVDPAILVGDNITVMAVLPVNAGGNITFRLNNSNKTVNVTESAVFDGLGEGTYTIYARFNGDDNYNPSEEYNITFSVVKVNPVLNIDYSVPVINETVTITVTMDKDISEIVNVTINGAGPVNKEVVNGTLVFTMVPAYGQQNITISFKGNDKYNELTNSTLFMVEKLDAGLSITADSIIYGDVLVVYVNTNEKFTGDVLVKVGDLNQTAHITKGKGNATFANLTAAEYFITANFTGNEIFNADNKNTTATVKGVDVPAAQALSTNVPANSQSPTFSINLPGATGNFTVSVDGKVVDTKPLKDGSASITVADLAVGDHKISISYSGDGKYAPIVQNTTLTIKAPVKTPAKVTPKATKIVAKKKTFKAKVKVKKYTITLKSGKTLLKKVKVTLKVKGKTYKATTNKKGKATFKIKNLKKKGTYKAVIKFKGNKNYKATSKKVKIKVKK